MYLFQLLKNQDKISPVSIYIPLCIYFNQKYCSDVLSAVIFTFHYVSISTLNRHRLNAHHLYLHSTMYLFQPSGWADFVTDEYIYIPLCIYFNPSRQASRSLSRRFTFHYVSISTAAVCDISTYKTNIYIPLCIYFNSYTKRMNTSMNPYLHSTMYLFQPNL